MLYVVYLIAMRKYLLFILCSVIFCSSIAQVHKGKKQNIAPSATPMTCKIEGQIMKMIPPSKADTGTPCATYPCRAMIKMIRVYGCGSSVSASLNKGDVVEMRFEYTLHNTSKIFPQMKVRYTGLKKGDIFIADAQQRIKMGGGVNFVIYDYKKR